MKVIASAVIGGGLVLAGLALHRLSSDAVGMTIGMILGVVSVLPAIVLVLHVANRNDPASDPDTVHYSWLAGSDRVRLRGGGLDGMWRREMAPAQQTSVIVVQERPATDANTGRFCVAWQPDAEAAITPYGSNTTRWATPVDGVVVVAGMERERRMVWATEPVESAIASRGLCLVRADEWDAWHRSQRGGA